MSQRPISQNEIVIESSNQVEPDLSMVLDLSKREIGDDAIRKLLYMICQRQDMSGACSKGLRNEHDEDDTTCSGSFPTSPTAAVTNCSKAVLEPVGTSQKTPGGNELNHSVTMDSEDNLTNHGAEKHFHCVMTKALSVVRCVLLLFKFSILFVLNIILEALKIFSDLVVNKLFKNLSSLLIVPCLEGVSEFLVTPVLNFLKGLLVILTETLDPLLNLLARLCELAALPIRAFRLVSSA